MDSGTSSMRCSSCQMENRDDVRFCEECGAPFARSCPRCGAEVQPAKRFCGDCGTQLLERPDAAADRDVPESERKRVTVIFCDIVNSTGLAERLGPEAMHALLNRFFELALGEVHRYGGTINKFLGDGFMALVGVPQTHEDHARRAVLAALGVQRLLGEDLPELQGLDAPLQARIGLNTGMVVVGSLGDDLEADFTAIGDTINVAARLESLAGPGEILISESTARLVTGYVRVEAVGPLQVKGKGEPVPAYRVLGLGPRRSPLEGLGPRALSRFVGRERQLGALAELLAQARDGQGQVVGLVAEPGMGKSRLVYEFRRSLAGERVTYLEGRCLSFGASIPYLPVLDIVRANCGITPTDAAEEVAEKARFGLEEVGMDGGEGTPYLLHVMGIREGTDALAGLSPEAIKGQIFEIVRQLALNGSRKRPIIFNVEDLHWIDSTSEELFASLVESLSGAPILLLCTYRPGYRPPWIDLSYSTQLSLRQLSDADGSSVVRSVLGAETAEDSVVRMILDRAEGNPFFLEELSRAVVEHADLGSEVAVPETIQGVLMARIDRLAEEPRRVLQTASVLGREFPVRLLAAIWDGPGTLEPHLLSLKRQEFLHERPGTSEPVYVFKHALTQDVAYDSMLTARRRALHEAAAQALERLHADRLEEAYDRLAHHYSKTAQAEKAVEYLSLFAETTFERYSHAEASATLGEALRHAERLPDGERDRRILELSIRLVNSLYFLGRMEESRDLLVDQRARMEALGDCRISGPYYFWLGHTYSHLGDNEGADSSARRAIEEGQRCEDLGTMGRGHYVICREGFFTGRFVGGVEHGRKAVSLLGRAGERWWLAQSHFFVGLNLHLTGDFDVALEAIARGLAIAEEIGDPRLQSYGAWCRGLFQATRGNTEVGIAECTRSLELSPDPLNTAWANGWLGFAYREHGDYDRAIAYLERAIASLHEYAYPRLLSWYEGWLSEAHLRRGDPERARELALHALAVAGEARFQWAGAQRALGRIALAAGAFSEATERLLEALETFAAIGARFEEASTRLDLAACAGRQDEGSGPRRISPRPAPSSTACPFPSTESGRSGLLVRSARPRLGRPSLRRRGLCSRLRVATPHETTRKESTCHSSTTERPGLQRCLG